MNPFDFACPICRSPLEQPKSDIQICPHDSTTFRCIDGVWRFLRPDRAEYFARFVREYEAVRANEKRGSTNAAYYRALPFADLTGRYTNDWKIRAASFRTLIDLLPPSLTIIDLGAGNGWLAYRLSQHGHTVAAIDLLTNDTDGLGAHRHYHASFTPIQAEFDALPLRAHQIDVAIFNSSLHYSIDYLTTLRETFRVLNDTGRVMLLDTPIYHDEASGKQMIAERQAQFLRAYGFPSNALAHENFLTYTRLEMLGQQLGVEWQTRKPWRGWRWAMRPWLARLRRQREPAEFLVIIGKRKNDHT
jgi:ubiquinone/menaquinone biosynthesis C-methylase UbiE